MTRFSDWLSSAWNTVKNLASKVGNFIDKAVPIVGRFIGKAAPIECDIGNFMRYLPGKSGTKCKTINNVAGRVDSVAEMLPSGLREKVE